MKSKIVKLTLEDLVEVLLSHGIRPKKVEAIVANLGIPQDCIKRALANIIIAFSQRKSKGIDYLDGKEKRGLTTEQS
jgi:hypothetical protein